jgi:uncharacterized repeat protein (TIGR01451 family)
MATKTAAREVDPIENTGDFDTSPGPIFDVPVRTILDDIKDAVEAYPTSYVKLEIVDIVKDGDIVNTGEEVRFHVRVTNDGPMTMKDVRLKAVAKNGTEVKSGSAAAVFGATALGSTIIDTLGGHGGSNEVSLFVLEAPNVAKPDGTLLVEVTVEEYNLLWDHILIGHSDPTTTPKATFSSSVEVDD